MGASTGLGYGLEQRAHRVGRRCGVGALPGALRVAAQVFVLECQHPLGVLGELFRSAVQEDPVPGGVGLGALLLQLGVAEFCRRPAP